MTELSAAKPVRAAVIGNGLAGAVFHAPLIASTPGMVVAAIVTSNRERQERARREYPSAAILMDRLPEQALEQRFSDNSIG